MTGGTENVFTAINSSGILMSTSQTDAGIIRIFRLCKVTRSNYKSSTTSKAVRQERLAGDEF